MLAGCLSDCLNQRNKNSIRTVGLNTKTCFVNILWIYSPGEYKQNALARALCFAPLV